MSSLRLRRPSPSMVIACLALAIALGGTGYAAIIRPANSVGTKQLKQNAVTSLKVKNGSLLSADFKAGQIPTGPAGPAGPAGPKGDVGATGPTGPTDTSILLGKTITVIGSGNAAAGAFGVTTVLCPSGYVAVGGGVDPGNVLTNYVTSSGPTIGGTRMLATPTGTQGPADGWQGSIFNNSASSYSYRVGVLCAKNPA